MAGMKKRLVWGMLAFLFVAGFTFYPGCGVNSGSSTGRPAYAVPGSGTGGGSGGGLPGGGSGGGSGGGGSDPGSGGGSAGGLENQLLQLINDGRAAKGVDPLQWDSQIAAVAEAYCRYMANKIGSQGFSEPYKPNMDGKGPSKRLQDGGVSFNKCAETGVLGDPQYLPPDVSTAQKAYAHLDHGKLNNPAYTRVGIGHHFEHFGG